MPPVTRTPLRRPGRANHGHFQALPNRIAFVLFTGALAWMVCVVSARAQAPAAGSNWDHLKALPAQTHLHISAEKGGSTCRLVSVDDATLVCGKKNFQRADVKSVKLTRYGISYGAGAGIGAGVGAGVGLGIAQSSQGDYFKDDKGSYAGGGAAVGAVIGTLVTGPLDLFRGPTVYRRQ